MTPPPYVRTAGESDIPALRRIWSLCFHDGGDYQDMFFDRRFARSRTLLALCGGVPAGAVYLFPIWLHEGGQRRKGIFGYACGVDPDFRRRGIFKALGKQALHMCEKTGGFLIVNPATDISAFGFAGLGLRESVFKKQLVVRAGCGAPLRFCPVDAAEYHRIRNRTFAREGYLEWDPGSIAYALEENRFCGGFAGRFEANGVQGAFLAVREGDTLRIRELAAPDEAAPELAAGLCHSLGLSRAVVDLPPYSRVPAELIPIAMTGGHAPPPDCYFNLYWE